MPRMARGGQAARGEGEQPLNPASSHYIRQAAGGGGRQPQGPARNRTARQAA